MSTVRGHRSVVADGASRAKSSKSANGHEQCFAKVVSIQIRFDRGTIVVDGRVSERNGVLWDDRTHNFRASAHRYVDVRASLSGRSGTDHVAPRLNKRTSAWLPVDLRSYQREALTAWLASGRRGIITLPTGAGKTRIAIAAAASVRLPTAVLCPTRVLLAQWVDALRSVYSGPVGVLGDGEHRLEDVTVMTFESAFRKMDAFGDRFALLVIDEAHHFGSGGRTEALELSVAPFRLGLTATVPEPGTSASVVLRELVGPVAFSMTLADLAGRALAPFEVIRLRVALSASERQEYARLITPFLELRSGLRMSGRELDFKATLKELSRTSAGRRAVQDYRRACSVASLPAKKEALTTSLIDRHRSDKMLIFAATATDARRVARENLVPAITAEIARDERDEILSRFKDGRLRCIVSARVLNEGVDVPDANVAILLGGALGVREQIQRIGRVLRPSPGKRAVVYDVATTDTVDADRADRKWRHVAAATAS